MIRRKISHLVVASTFVLAMLGAGSTVAFATDRTTPGSDLANDVHAGELGEKAAANDVDTAEEVDEDGAVEDVDEMEVGDSAAAQSQS
jgi:hypothetical protein